MGDKNFDLKHNVFFYLFWGYYVLYMSIRSCLWFYMKVNILSALPIFCLGFCNYVLKNDF